MEFKEGAPVRTADGKDVGRVDRVVLNPRTKEVTHVVVRKGLLFREDKIVPLSLIAMATGEGLMLRPDAGDLDHLPPFEETHYVPADEADARAAAYQANMATPLYWYPPLGGWMGYSNYAYAYPPPYPVETEQNIPAGTVALQEGARVITADGQEVGSVEEIFTDSQADRVTYFVMGHGRIIRDRKLIPATWIRSIEEEAVHLTVGAGVVDGLRDYEPT